MCNIYKGGYKNDRTIEAHIHRNSPGFGWQIVSALRYKPASSALRKTGQFLRTHLIHKTKPSYFIQLFWLAQPNFLQNTLH